MRVQHSAAGIQGFAKSLKVPETWIQPSKLSCAQGMHFAPVGAPTIFPEDWLNQIKVGTIVLVGSSMYGDGGMVFVAAAHAQPGIVSFYVSVLQREDDIHFFLHHSPQNLAQARCSVFDGHRILHLIEAVVADVGQYTEVHRIHHHMGRAVFLILLLAV